MAKQRTFFEDEPGESFPSSERISSHKLAPWEIDDLADQKIAKIVFPTGYDAVLDYVIPRELVGKLEPGMRVMVPLGRSNRAALGYCVGVEDYMAIRSRSAELGKVQRLKAVKSLVDERRLLDDKMIRLTQWISWRYLCPMGQVLEAMLPAGVRSSAGTRLATVLSVAEDLDKKLEILKRKQGPGDISTVSEKNRSKKQSGFLTPKQFRVLETLRNSPEPLTSQELQRAAKCSSVPIETLKRLGLVRAKTVRRQKPDAEDSIQTTLQIDPHQLNADQHRVLDRINDSVRNHRYETFLLHGVTGSGKTEVYIQAIHEVVRQRRQAIVLVPEISLTPQTVGRFKSRFPDVAVLHSHLTDAERHRQWAAIAEGNIQVVVGARSAVFAPLPRLGLIVIDEEHENSFKQDVAPRYHAREVAQKRAEDERIPLILGSATPSLESWVRAARADGATAPKNVIAPAGRLPEKQEKSVSEISGRDARTDGASEYKLLSMPSRVKNLQLPAVEIVDLREEVRSRTTRGAVHRQLHSAIRQALDDKGQVILLLNRRGFSTHIQCPACGEALRCPNCDVSLTHHRSEEIALCHYCDYQVPAPDQCPKCNFRGIRYGGFGTQKLETEIKSRFPDATILRMDTDTMQGHGAHERALTQFREGKVQILLGTQMIAKGLDFPNVTLVGVINADTALHLPDFRASERTFHLITQVAGRTGRGDRGGRVIVQTFSPDHPAIVAAARHDYRSFVDQEIPVRKLLGYPPFTSMIRIVVRGENETKTLDFAREFATNIKTASETASFATNNSQLKILGPAPAPFAKLRGLYRFHIHLHATDADSLRDLVRQVSLELKTPKDIQWIIDVDPIDML